MPERVDAKRPPPLIQLPEVDRKCLKCRLPFKSTGDRICPKCTKDNKNVAKRVDSSGSGIRRSGDGSRDS